MLPFWTFRSALLLAGACWLTACSFPDYELEKQLASVCTDGQPSDAETGIDCGGGCPPCGMGEPCRTYQDCESLACDSGTCQMPTCSDGVKNGAEADKDCGGQCGACGANRDCQVSEDCSDGVCSGDLCQVANCTDQVQNGSETDLDCGSSCGACPNGKHCQQNSDCAEAHCVDGTCVTPSCIDRTLSGTESDLDCGGGECGPCAANLHCLVGDDCVSHICEKSACTAYSCEDGVPNGTESALDCGGTSCPGCGSLQHCNGGSDCASGACQSNRCVPSAPSGVVLARDGWQADAAESYPDDTPNQVLDSLPGRWTSGTNQYDGMWFQVDMGQLQTFFSVVLVCEEQDSDTMSKYDLYLSVDGNYGTPTKPGQFGKTTSEVTFDTAQVARYIKWVVRQPKSKWLSIDEIKVVQ